MDNALKAINRTDDELRVVNYIVLFNGRDLEGVASPRKNGDGSTGEFFTKSTVFDSDYTQTGVVYVDWEHSARDGATSDDILGYVDWKTARIDEKGIFVERVLNRRNRYVQYVEELIDAGLIGNSSEAVTAGVAKSPNGEIRSWPIRRDSLTVTPMEPRMLSQNAIAAIKGLSERYHDLRAFINEPANVVDEQAKKEKSEEIAKSLGLLDLLAIECSVMAA